MVVGHVVINDCRLSCGYGCCDVVGMVGSYGDLGLGVSGVVTWAWMGPAGCIVDGCIEIIP